MQRLPQVSTPQLLICSWNVSLSVPRSKGLLKSRRFPSSLLAHTLTNSVAFCFPDLTKVSLEFFFCFFKLPLNWSKLQKQFTTLHGMIQRTLKSRQYTVLKITSALWLHPIFLGLNLWTQLLLPDEWVFPIRHSHLAPLGVKDPEINNVKFHLQGLYGGEGKKIKMVDFTTVWEVLWWGLIRQRRRHLMQIRSWCGQDDFLEETLLHHQWRRLGEKI